MAKKFKNLRAKMSPERQKQNKAEADRTLLEITLQELRQNVTNLSQEDIADILRVTQGYVSKLERQDDMLLSRLYAYVKALGGELEIRAKFPDDEVRMNEYRDVEKLRHFLLRDSRTRTERTYALKRPRIFGVKLIERIGLTQALTEWGIHEAAGRLHDQLNGTVSTPLEALGLVLRTRLPLVAKLLFAEPLETWRIEVAPADIPNLHTLEHPLDGHSRAMVADVSASGAHVRSLVAAEKIEGPILATAKFGERRLFFIDGLHRMWAWAELVRQGRGKGICATLVVTQSFSWWADEWARREK